MLTEEEVSRVSPFVTNMDRPVFGFNGLSPVIVGALFGRYSRSSLSARELLAREFLGNDDLTDPAKAESFIERVLLGFGDDSVAELAATTLAIEGGSNVLAKIIEDRRIGISPLEKSTRYVRFDQRNNAERFAYWRDPDIASIGLGDVYEKAMDCLFETYAQSIPVLIEHLKKRFERKPDQTERAYNSALRAQACDVARYLLPMATETNVGVVGNGRAFEYLIYQLRASGLKEGELYAELIGAELAKVIPAFVKRAGTDRGAQYATYLSDLKAYTREIGNRFQVISRFPANPAMPGVSLQDFDKAGEQKIAAGLLYEHSECSFGDCLAFVESRPELVAEVITNSLAMRGHRTHKPSRAFEHAVYQFEIVCDIGAFRDLHRHRVLTQQRQPYTTAHGYVVPEDVIAANLEDVYRFAMDKANDTYNAIVGELPNQSQYVVPFGYLIRFNLRLNAREAYHLCELRSTIQGHWSYRYVAQEMARLITRVHPSVGGGMMITWDGYDELSRVASEQRREQKAQIIESE